MGDYNKDVLKRVILNWRIFNDEFCEVVPMQGSDHNSPF
jgi:hypothetical protein